MLDDMFFFIDPITDPVVELGEDDVFHSTVRMVEVYFDLMAKKGVDRKKSPPKELSDIVKTDIPLDIALSLLRPDELEKLRNYITSYLMQRDNSETE